MIYKGRTKIFSEFTQEDMRDINNVANMVATAFITHTKNKTDIDKLINYRLGKQDIINKKKEIRPEINNKLVLNHAQMITRTIVGYFLGTPIQYIQNSADQKEEIDKLNRYVAYEDKASVDREIGEYQSVCGTAYRIIFTDGVFQDEIPFEDRCLNPSNTFVVYENSISEKPLAGVTYRELLNEEGKPVGNKVFVYTGIGLYEFETEGDISEIEEVTEYLFTPYDVGGVPIIEYPNNMWRIGDWELVIDLMDAINSLQSGRLDDVDQIVQSLLVIVNADIDEEEYAKMRNSGLVCLKNTTNSKTEINSIKNELDQAGMNMYSKELEEILYALVGIPDRNNRAGGGGDTGQAVELRDGWADLEIIARNKEQTFRKAEKQSLKIILTILANTKGFKLGLADVDVKFSRNKNNNLLVKAQAYTTLVQSKTLHPVDCLTIADLVTDPNEYIARGEDFWGEEFAGKQKEEEEQPLEQMGNEQKLEPKEDKKIENE